MTSSRVLMSTNIPAEFQTALFDDYDTDRGDPYLLEQVSTWEPTVKRPSMLLAGKPGKAKTMLAAATLNEVQRDMKFRTVSGRDVPPGALTVLRQERRPVYFIQMADWIDLKLRLIRMESHGSADLGDPVEYFETDQLLEDLKNRVQYLVIDDVGKEHRTASGFAEDQFDYFVRTRCNNGLFTIFTSNVPLSRWSLYSPSMVNFIDRTSRVLEFR